MQFSTVMMTHGYTGEFEIMDDYSAGEVTVNLTGRMNKCGVVSPIFDIQLRHPEQQQNNLLPSYQLFSLYW
jgi:small subunit ribosomal protein S15Ae